MRSNTISILALVTLFSVSGLVSAAIKPNEEAASLAAKASKAKDSSDESKLRCWQYGELLFEESGVSNQTLGKDPESIAFKRVGDKSKKLILVDVGTATCLFED